MQIFFTSNLSEHDLLSVHSIEAGHLKKSILIESETKLFSTSDLTFRKAVKHCKFCFLCSEIMLPLKHMHLNHFPN